MKAWRCLWGILAFPLAAGCFAACSHSTETPSAPEKTPPAVEVPAPKGIVGIGIAEPNGSRSEEESHIAFTDDDIAQFNSVTREIRFRQVEPAKWLDLYARIRIELDGEALFTALTVSPVSSREIRDLVFEIEHTDNYRYYLRDGYPARAAETEEARANTEARAAGRERFLRHLEATGRLTDEADRPGENQGENPGDNPGDNPGENPGENPDDNPGENPGENPGDDGPFVPGEEFVNQGDIELTLYPTREKWQWEIGHNTLHVVRNEAELQACIAPASYSPSGIDFEKYTLLLVRVGTHYGIGRVGCALTQTPENYTYSMRVLMNVATVIGDWPCAVLAPAIPAQTPVAFTIDISHDYWE